MTHCSHFIAFHSAHFSLESYHIESHFVNDPNKRERDIIAHIILHVKPLLN